MSSLTDDGRELIADGKVGNELAVYDEYPAHPEAGEGPWHLLPKGPVVVLVQRRRRVGAALPLPARRARGRARTDRVGAALHPDADAVAWRGAGGLQHHDRRVHRRGQAAAAALAVPGARSDAGQRGRRRGHRPRVRAAARARLRRVRRHRETSRPHWTIRRTAGSGCRRRCGSGSATDVRAVSVAEVVSPTEAESAPLARDLMVALVRAGVTATCSSADRPRYGEPGRRLQPAGRPHRGRRTRPERVHRSRFGRSRSRVRRGAQAAAVRHRRGQGVGARRGAACGDLAARRGPARTRGRCRCLSSPGTALDDAVASRRRRPRRRRDLRRCNRRRRRWSRSNSGPWRCSTAGCRASPSTPTEPCTPSLMRSCTGWPSGVVDGPAPRRTAPDGSNFQLQHWTHTFDYALVSRRRRLAVGSRSRAQRGVLAPAACRRRKRQRRRRIARVGLAAGDRALRLRPAGRAEGGGQPARVRQQPARRPDRGRRGPTGRNIGNHSRCRDHIRAAQGVVGVARRTCSKSRACRSTGHSRGSPCTAMRSPRC